MKPLDFESQFILYFIREQNSPVKRREIECRYPRMTKGQINYRLDKMEKVGLIRKKENQEYSHGINATYEWVDVLPEVDQYEETYTSLATPAWKWHEFSDQWFETFGKRLGQLERQMQDG